MNSTLKRLGVILEYKIVGKHFIIEEISSDDKNGVSAMSEIFKYADNKKLDVILENFESKIKELGLNKSEDGVNLIASLLLAMPLEKIDFKIEPIQYPIRPRGPRRSSEPL